MRDDWDATDLGHPTSMFQYGSSFTNFFIVTEQTQSQELVLQKRIGGNFKAVTTK